MLLSSIIFFVITIIILVVVHEAGHFFAAKLSGMRAEAFAIGFGYRLFGYNKITGFTFGKLPTDFDGGDHTDYRLCAVPLGGYVKISGMVDESFDTEFANSTPKDYEFRSKSIPRKIFVLSAGVLMNLLLAILIFWGASYFQGKELSKTTTVGFVEKGSNADSAGFLSNDKILSVNGAKHIYWEEIREEIFINSVGQDVNIEVDRGNQVINLNVPRKYIPKDDNEKIFLLPQGFKPVIGDVVSGGPAQLAGIKTGDIILSLNDEQIASAPHTIRIISSSKEKEVLMKALRNKDTISIKVTPNKEGKIGIAMQSYVFLGQTEKASYGIFQAFGVGVKEIIKMTKLTFSMGGKVFGGQVEFGKVFGGPIKIAQYAAISADRGFINFLMFLGMLSLSLAIINIMPFPVLDGGHLVIVLIEGAIKRELSIKVKIYIQNAGFAILLLLMGFIIFNDIKGL